jgi:hypothetical protein
MPKYRFIYEPDFKPQLPYQSELDRIAKDLDRTEVEKESIEPVVEWTLDLFRTIYPGAECMGPVTKKGGAVIFLGDTGEVLIKPLQNS